MITPWDVDDAILRQYDRLVAWAWDHHEVPKIWLQRIVILAWIVGTVITHAVNGKPVALAILLGLSLWYWSIQEKWARYSRRTQNILIGACRADLLGLVFRVVILSATVSGTATDLSAPQLAWLEIALDLDFVVMFQLVHAYVPDRPGGTRRREARSALAMDAI